jgi:hypothetical protein
MIWALTFEINIRASPKTLAIILAKFEDLEVI